MATFLLHCQRKYVETTHCMYEPKCIVYGKWPDHAVFCGVRQTVADTLLDDGRGLSRHCQRLPPIDATYLQRTASQEIDFEGFENELRFGPFSAGTRSWSPKIIAMRYQVSSIIWRWHFAIQSEKADQHWARCDSLWRCREVGSPH